MTQVVADRTPSGPGSGPGDPTVGHAGGDAVLDLAGLAPVTHRMRLRPGVGIEMIDAGTFVLVHSGQRGAPQRVSAWLLELLQRLAGMEMPEDELQASALAAGGPLGLFRWVETARRLDAVGFIEHAGYSGGVLLSRLISVGAGPTLPVDPFDPAAQQRVSSLALVRVQPGQGWVAHRPGSHLAVQIGPAALAVLAAACEWTDWTTIQRRSGLAGAEVRAIAEHLARSGVFEQWRTDDAAPADPTGPGSWNAFDWWLHARSRSPRALHGWAGSYPGRDVREPLPAVPERRTAVGIALPAPDLERLTAAGSEPLAAVMERRASVREHDDEHPITAAQLGELLYRTLRIRAVFRGADGQDAVDRPIPSGGALHELEVYPIIHLCAGIEPGMYRYRADSHELEWVAGRDEPGVAALFAGAQAAYTKAEPPQVVLVISARFGRVSYKYDAIGYALTLKNTGVLLANLYLVATDMRLAGTAVGSGSIADFALATGLDPFTEGSVGEFVLGSSTAAAQTAARFAGWEGSGGVPLPGDAPGP